MASMNCKMIQLLNLWSVPSLSYGHDLLPLTGLYNFICSKFNSLYFYFLYHLFYMKLTIKRRKLGHFVYISKMFLKICYFLNIMPEAEPQGKPTQFTNMLFSLVLNGLCFTHSLSYYSYFQWLMMSKLQD